MADPDAAIAEAAASSSSLREVALKLGATPATGTLSHIRRRISQQEPTSITDTETPDRASDSAMVDVTDLQPEAAHDVGVARGHQSLRAQVLGACRVTRPRSCR
ncbi:hypothetical protein GCM10010330_23130 [Streptomyces tendae]|nr:hypothetical protein GCM10010330_23130 [Streptomyces tendae]